MPSSDASSGADSANPQVKLGRNADGFMKSVYRFFDGLAKNSRGLGALIAVVLVLMLAATLLMGKREKASSAAQDALFVAQKKHDAELKALLPPPPAAPIAAKGKDAKTPPAPKEEDVEFKALDVNAKLPETVKAYRAVIAGHEGTRAAHDARMALGHLYLQHSQAVPAEEVFLGASKSAPRGVEQALAFSALGYAREGQGKFKEAIDAFNQALSTNEEAVKGDVLMAIARCYEEMHDSANARSTYDKVISQLANSEHARNAETFKAQLQ